ncbi:MAG: hypothetical protein AVO35_10660 [Candidatus Aegiribacteria sp. MLS_C]|nr:MAG: hypothetical protein AVO35_10660 [Candidatus Aegiribacteria sp. MLS_C]
MVLFSQAVEWETDIGYLPFSSPLLVDNGSGSMDIFVALGDRGLGGWTGTGESLEGFPLSSEQGVSGRPAAFYSPETGSTLVYADNRGAVHMVDRAGIELPGWPLETGSSVVTGISVVNLDDDCTMEIAFGTSDGMVHLVDRSGRPAEGWPVELPSRMQWQPSQLSLGGNSGYGLVCGLANMKLYLLSRSGTVLPGWPVSTGFTLGSTPVCGDIDADGLGDVVLSTNNDRVYALNCSGAVIDGWPFFLDDRVAGGALAIGHLDLTGGNLQVAVSTMDGKVTLLRGSGSLAGTWRWPNLTAGVPTSPVISSSGGNPAVIAGCDSGYVYAWNAQGDGIQGFPVAMGQAVSRTPAAGDVDGDGSIELIVLGRSGTMACISLSGSGGRLETWQQILCDQFNSGSFGTSHLPGLTAGTVASEASGTVVLPYTVEGTAPQRLTLAYSTNAGYSWTETTSFGTTAENVEWYSEADLPGHDERECALKVTPWCAAGPGTSGLSNVFHLDNNSPPTLSISSIEEESSGRFLIFYSVEDPERDIIQLQAQYSSDGGEHWLNADLSGSTLQIPSWLYGDPVRWDASSVEGLSEVEDVLLRMRAADADPGPWSAISLDEGLRDHSVAQIVVPSEEVSDEVRLGVRLSDPKDDPMSFLWEYSTDGGESWERATVTGSRVPVTGNCHYEITWDSSVDIPGLDAASVRFRASGSEDGDASLHSSPFHVDNNRLPVLEIRSPGRWDHFSGSVPISFDISDAEGDSISMLLEYRIEGTPAWVPATGLIPSGYYPHSTYSSSLTWNSSEDLPGSDRLELRIRLGATDRDTVFTGEVGPISVDNSRLPAAMQAAVSRVSPHAGTVEVSYELSDPRERTLDLMVTYSSDRGRTWRDATVTGDLASRSVSGYQGSFTWNSEQDMDEWPPDSNRGVMLKITPVSKELLGAPRILEIELD